MLFRFVPLICVTIYLFASCSTPFSGSSNQMKLKPPNIIVILADDQGYGDLSCYGSPTIKSPHLDELASNGMRLTNFYAFPSCSPSRAALLTGCYPPRVGIPDVIGPAGPDWTKNRQYGLHPQEDILPEILSRVGYRSALIGKWHLGHFPETMPLAQGFDYFYGLPYSNDMRPELGEPYPDLTLMRGKNTIKVNPDQSQLVTAYTNESIAFIERTKDQPFFLYLAHSMPHVPLYASKEFAGRSGQGLYVDVIEEIDASVGRIVDYLRKKGKLDNTLIIYTSDNGPWLTYGNHAGSAGPFREGKGTTYEGGMRVPFIAHWPNGIEAGVISHASASLIDLLPTLGELAGTEQPDKTVDGRSLHKLLTEGQQPDETPFYYYRSGQVEAVRLGKWKLHRPHYFRYVDQPAFDGEGGSYAHRETEMVLYDLSGDPGERYNRAEFDPGKVAELLTLIEAEQERIDRDKRPAWFPPNE
ncbi:N-acetylgalactosamine-6-sulfatase [Lewinellaceae bacterium SD302]|nr:N-acetylgalactosamine-6-sulfatase [Lewinellaceae bacterium SD302]